MKFHELEMNQEFLYQGKLYVKASPVLAREPKTGLQKFMRRADFVEPHSPLPGFESSDTTKPDDELIQKRKVKAMFERFVKTCQASFEKELESFPSTKKNKIHSSIKKAKSQFLRDLNQ